MKPTSRVMAFRNCAESLLCWALAGAMLSSSGQTAAECTPPVIDGTWMT